MSQEIEVKIEDTIVSSTDRDGKIIYANKTFCDIAGYKLEEVLGEPHNIIRHQDMPKAIFKLLWREVLNGNSLYAFVKNRAKNGDFYFVKAFIKPVVQDKQIIQIISYRRKTNSFAQEFITSFYSKLVSIEKNESVDKSLEYFDNYLQRRNLKYQDFIDRLSQGYSIQNESLLSLNILKYKIEHILLNEQLNSKRREDETLHLSTMCDFEQWCQSVKHESFAQTKDFKKIVKLHDDLHATMSAQTNKLSNEFTSKNQEFFANLVTFVNTTKE